MVPVPDQECVQVHFEQLCEDNEATNPKVIHVENLQQKDLPNFGNDIYAVLLLGQQEISKFKESAKNLVNIYMCLIRLPSVTTDIIITFNDPVLVNPQSSSKPDSVTSSLEEVQAHVLLFKSMLRSFKIEDWSLFGQ